MTSTTSSGNPHDNSFGSINTYDKKHQFLWLFLWNLRRLVPTGILYILILFLAAPFTLFLSLISSPSNYLNAVSDISNMFSFSEGVIVPIFILIISIMSFSYMHNKRRVDMFGSLPVTRRTLFFSQYLSALVMLIVPFMVTWLVTLIMSLGSSDAIYNLLSAFLPFIITIVACVTFTGFISLCCGTTVDTIVSVVIINVFSPLMILLCLSLATGMLPGIDVSSSSISGYTFLTPFFWIIESGINGQINYYSNASYHILYKLLFSIVFFVLSYFFSRKRKAEAAQSGFAFTTPSWIIRFIATISVGTGGGMLLASIFNSATQTGETLWFWIGFVIFSFITHFILTMIYNRGVSGFLKSLIFYASTCAVAVLAFVCLSFGLFGLDTSSPSIESTAEAKFSLYNSYGVGSTSSSYYDKYGDFYPSDNFESRVIFKVKDKASIETITELQRKMVEEYRATHGYPYNIKSLFGNYMYSSTDSEPIFFFDLLYTLNNGSTVSRSYSFSEDFLSKNEDLFNKLFDEETKNINNVFDDNIKLNRIGLFHRHQSSNNTGYSTRDPYRVDQTLYDGLYAAIKQDVLDDDEYFTSNYLQKQEHYLEAEIYYRAPQSSIENTDNIVMCTSYKIPAKYKNTLKYLTDNGIVELDALERGHDLLDYDIKDTYLNDHEDIDKAIENYKGNYTLRFEKPDDWSDNLYCQMVMYSNGYIPIAPMYHELDKCSLTDNTAYYTVPAGLNRALPQTSETYFIFYDDEGHYSNSLTTPFSEFDLSDYSDDGYYIAFEHEFDSDGNLTVYMTADFLGYVELSPDDSYIGKASSYYQFQWLQG